MLPSSDKLFNRFLAKFAFVGAVLYASIVGLVSILVGGQPWRDALIGAAIGAACGAIRAAQKARGELETLTSAVLEAAAFYGPPLGQDGVRELQQLLLARAREKLSSVRFHTVDVGGELAPPSG